MASRRLFDSAASFRFAFPLLVLLYLVLQIPPAKALLATGSGLSTDDAMRLVEVRDLLNGQGWFDLVQHRVLPPDGLSMHWSRYIDAPMAAIVSALEPFVGQDLALRALAMIWPLSLGILFIALTARLTRRLFGWQAASLSILLVLTYSLLSNAGFGVGATDHHAVQIILMLVLCDTLLDDRHPLRKGVTGGLAAAMSLAVGLEMILFIGTAGLLLVFTHGLDRPGSAAKLMGFATALALAVPILMAGQVDPALWNVAVCDAISPPLIALTTTAFAASATVVMIGQKLKRPAMRFAVLGAVGAMAAILLAPVLAPCAAGPYTAMTPEIQRSVLGRIQEIKPALHYLGSDAARSIALFLPFYLITALFGAMVVARRGKGFVILCFLLLGSALSFWQMRMTTMGLPVIAIAFGGALSWAISQSNPAMRLAGIGTGVFVLFSQQIAVLYVSSGWTGTGTGKATLGLECTNVTEMARLDALETGIVFNPLNLGPIILLASSHSVTAAPYYRSADAFANGILPFEGDEADLRAAIDRTGADYLLFCAGNTYGPATSIGSILSKGGERPWLAEIPLSNSKLRVFRVLG